MTIQLIFIRHARSTWNDAGRWQGQADPPLSETGQSEARILADRLAGWTINAIYASDLVRASTTATVVGERLGLHPVIDPIWRERGIGVFEGLTGEEIRVLYPDAWAKLHKGPMDGVPGAEPIESVLDRARTGCRTLTGQHQDETVVVFSHGGMILATLVHLLDLVPVGFGRLVGGAHTAISQVTIMDGHARLVRLNDSAHLELKNGRSTN
jgi:2,3-bisphosphoglycerate-dependent phosphoglycerate mutase